MAILSIQLFRIVSMMMMSNMKNLIISAGALAAALVLLAGDVNADDSAMVQAAIDGAAGTQIMLAAGSYQINQQVWIRAGASISGISPTQTVLVMGPGAGLMIQTNDPVYLSNLCIQGSGSGTGVTVDAPVMNASS